MIVERLVIRIAIINLYQIVIQGALIIGLLLDVVSLLETVRLIVYQDSLLLPDHPVL